MPDTFDESMPGVCGEPQPLICVTAMYGIVYGTHARVGVRAGPLLRQKRDALVRGGVVLPLRIHEVQTHARVNRPAAANFAGHVRRELGAVRPAGGHRE